MKIEHELNDLTNFFFLLKRDSGKIVIIMANNPSAFWIRTGFFEELNQFGITIKWRRLQDCEMLRNSFRMFGITIEFSGNKALFPK